MSIFKLSSASQNAIQAISVEGRACSAAFSIALARAVADCSYCNSGDGLQFATEIVSALNELVLVDRAYVLELVIKLKTWDSNTFEPKAMIYNTKETAVVDFFGISRYFDATLLGVVANEISYISRTYNTLTSIINELAKSED